MRRRRVLHFFMLRRSVCRRSVRDIIFAEVRLRQVVTKLILVRNGNKAVEAEVTGEQAKARLIMIMMLLRDIIIDYL